MRPRSGTNTQEKDIEMKARIGRSLGVATGLVITLFLAMQIAPAFAKSTAQKLRSSDLPAAVTASLNRLYPNAKVTQFVSEDEQGRQVFDVETAENGIERDLLIDPNGTVIEIGEHMKVSDLPAPVVSAVKSAHPHGKIEEAELKTASGENYYEVLVESGGTDIELRISTSGIILAGSNDDENEEKEEDGDDD